MFKFRVVLLFSFGLLHGLSMARASFESSVGECLTNSLDKSLYCRGSRAIRNVINNLSKNDKPIVIMRGLEIVPSKDTLNGSTTDAPTDGDSYLERLSAYLRTHELNLKFSDLMDNENEDDLARDFMQNNVGSTEGVGVKFGNGVEEGRKKDKGQGIILAMALMFGKMLAVMGLGGIGAIALKALGVATAALMMAGLIGLKSLAQHGNESSHSVSYVTADGHHHRRRRRRYATNHATTAPVTTTADAPSMDMQDAYDPLPLVYSGWQK